MYFMIVIELLKDIILRSNTNSSLFKEKSYYTNCISNLSIQSNNVPFKELLDYSIDVIDEYMTQGGNNSIFREPNFKGDINSFLKSEQLGKGDFTPILSSLIEDYKRLMKRSPNYDMLLNSTKEKA
ncbi:hypothetical protein SBF1_1350005 [Candidatus Desulfosporosinus infrequens]|uniref:Uncharacterized protein n=1 Tax=Candidatus Desulfosporosinus infrequens TaxID=2043169 RepID=A0A2U3K4A1_9FIRM|nr:hypothetical protein SBF1_1350005 [Candidatus Desulfosporosinus infrequens]